MNTTEFTVFEPGDPSTGHSQETGVSATANNPLDKACGSGFRYRAIGTGDEVGDVEAHANTVGYAFFSYESTGGGKAAITGDFVLIGTEVNPVIQALRANGINVTALHSHMLDEEPRLFFMHFWANDDAVKLAQGLRAALDKTNSQKAK